MIKIIKNAKLINNEIVNILIIYDKIVSVSKKDYIDLVKNMDCEVIDAKNNYVIPSYIDNHVHIIGGGGEDGFISKINELDATDV